MGGAVLFDLDGTLEFRPARVIYVGNEARDGVARLALSRIETRASRRNQRASLYLRAQPSEVAALVMELMNG